MVWLPMDVVYTNILPKCPAKSLLRFKCVSKSFKEIISSPKFIDLQHRHALSSSANRLVVISEDINCLDVYNLDGTSISPPYKLPFPEFSFEFGHIFSVVASCQCYVLIAFGFTVVYDFILFNPSTGSYTETTSGYDGSFRNLHSHCDYYGIGYDLENDDYKILRIRDFRFSNVYYTPRRELLIYRFNSESWKWFQDVDTNDNQVESKSVGAALVKNHLLHWAFRSLDEQSTNIIRIRCFDICSEQWVNDVPLPESLINSTVFSRLGTYIDVVVFEECLCFLVENNDEDTFDMWIMEEYGVQSSWFKLVAVPISCAPNRAGMYPISYRTGSRNEILIYQQSTSKFYWYNIRDEVLTNATELNNDVPNYYREYEVYTCKGSLVTTFGAAQIRTQRPNDDY